MSDTPRPEDERDLLAAEHALGLLTGAELMEAHRLAGEDQEFARAVAEWEERLAPLADEARAVEPDPRLWERIRSAIAAGPGVGAEVIALRRRLTVWRTVAAAAGAAAASLALIVGWQASREEPVEVARPAERAPVMVATLASPEEETSLSVAYDTSDSSLIVTPGRMAGAAGHDHELWIIPAGGQPVSLGLVRADGPQRITVPRQVAPHFRARAGVALSVEPAGGSPTGQPTGPVVASGELIVV